MVGAQAPARREGVLLCTGSTANKDLETLVAYHLPEALGQHYSISVLGLHKPGDLARLEPLREYIASGQLRLCGQLSDQQVAQEYRAHALVWVHSLREGFGRCVVEGRLAGTRVIASDIAEFAELTDDEVYLYEDSTAFMAILTRLADIVAPTAPYAGYPYRELLHSAVAGTMRLRESQSAARSPQAISIPQDTVHKKLPRNRNP
jgi:Glycosyl transferases group 1